MASLEPEWWICYDRWPGPEQITFGEVMGAFAKGLKQISAQIGTIRDRMEKLTGEDLVKLLAELPPAAPPAPSRPAVKPTNISYGPSRQPFAHRGSKY